MTRISILLSSFLCATMAFAQIPQWVISPKNDTIFVKVDNQILQGREGNKSTLWDMNGKELYSTNFEIFPFSDGVATVYDPTRKQVKGFVALDGEFTELPQLDFAYGNPYFDRGLLLIKNDTAFYYYKKDGTLSTVFPEVEKPYPFHHGYATFSKFDNKEKKKDFHYGYFKADNSRMKYRVLQNGEYKEVEEKNIEFLSSLAADGRGIAVIKNKLYWFNPKEEAFEPLLIGNDENEKKRHLNLARDHEAIFMAPAGDSIFIEAKYSKNKFAKVKFNRELVPLEIVSDDENISFEVEPPKPFQYETRISSFGDGKLGLNYDKQNVVPEQFDKIGLRYGNRAMAKFNGKWGVVEILPDAQYTLKVNKGEDVAFRHQKFETQLRLDLPARASASEFRIDVVDDDNFILDKTSRFSKDTESGNYVTYNCEFLIPASLPDTITNVTYGPLELINDGIVMYQTPLNLKAWHLKYYNVDPIDSETSITNGVLSFTVNINAQKIAGEGDYAFDVAIDAENVDVESEKLSETRRKFLVSNLKEGDNNFNIIVTEKGCPPSVFPFVIQYTSPVPKKRQKEEVVIRKKDKSPTPAPQIAL